MWSCSSLSLDIGYSLVRPGILLIRPWKYTCVSNYSLQRLHIIEARIRFNWIQMDSIFFKPFAHKFGIAIDSARGSYVLDSSTCPRSSWIFKVFLNISSALSNSPFGLVYKQRGDISRAREYWEKSVELFKKIGMPHMVEKVQGWIDGVENWEFTIWVEILHCAQNEILVL